MNIARLTDATSYTIAPGHELRRANADEIEFIKSTFERRILPHPFNWDASVWERPLDSSEGPLPESEWRYFVMSRGENPPPFQEFQETFDLSPLELEAGIFAIPMPDHGAGVGFVLPRVFQVLEENYRNDSFFVDVSARDIDQMRAIHSQLCQWQGVGPLDVRSLARQLSDLKCLPHRSQLRFLGYFALLESLLTHPPKPLDPYDSITRQVKKKLALLDRRFSRKIDYAPFGGAGAESVWSKMYDYRSLVAHGGSPQFAGQLQVLGNAETALTLIKETVKAVIRQALTEPQLIVDLRDC
ncbi:MAG: hypothetical protein ACRD5K_05905 [Candidatus Acidiferrales bacterium]